MSYTAQGVDWPSLLQFSVFLPNRLGGLQHLLRCFRDQPTHILGISVVNLVDSAIVRLVFSEPERARKLLNDAGYAYNETSLLAVEISEQAEHPMLDVCTTLLQCEVSIDYVYPMFRSQAHPAVLVLHVEELPTAAEALQSRGFRLLSESDLE